MLTSSPFEANASFGSPPRVANDKCLSPIFSCSPSTGAKEHTGSNTIGDVIKDFVTCFTTSMSSWMKMQILNHIFKQYVIGKCGLDFFKFVNDDFLRRSLDAIKTLFCGGKANLLYCLSKCFEAASPRMPLDRMPYGLIDYNIPFFASDTTVNLNMEEHYASWLETMFSQFGHKWLCLHRGPMWQYERDANLERPLLVVTNHGDGNSSISNDAVEVGIIQEALQHSSIDLDTDSHINIEEDLEIFEHVDLSISNLSISDDAVTTLETCEDIQTDFSINLSLESIAEEEPLNVSHLWTSVSTESKKDAALGLVPFQELEKFHHIQPPGNRSCQQHNSDIYDPLKVSV